MRRIVCFAMLLYQAHAYAPSGPQPPCGEAAVPGYPGLDNSPNVRVRQLKITRILFRQQLAIAVNRRIEAGHVHFLRLGRQLLECQGTQPIYFWHEAQ
jgi:hypothetical protein